MATFTRVYTFTLDLAKKVHNLSSDTIKVAFCAAANAPTTGTTKYSDLTVASAAFADSVTITVSSCTQSSGVTTVVFADKTITATGGAIGPFRYVVIYNDTATNKEVIGYADKGADITLADTETILLDFTATPITIGA